MPHVQIYRDIMAYISQSGWTPQVFCNATGEASISSLVASGFGVSIVAKTDVLDNSQVKLLHLKDRLYKRTIYMAYRRDEEQPPLCRPSCVSSSSGPGRSPTLSGTAERAEKPGWDPMVPSGLFHTDPAGRQTPAGPSGYPAKASTALASASPAPQWRL